MEQPIDMTTGEGRAFAQMLAVFGELEASAISARVAAARRYMLKSGRAVGGTVPYGWQNIPNPDGVGKVRAIDPDRSEWVLGMIQRAQRGDSIYSICKWLTEAGAPLPTGSQSKRVKDGWGGRPWSACCGIPSWLG